MSQCHGWQGATMFRMKGQFFCSRQKLSTCVHAGNVVMLYYDDIDEFRGIKMNLNRGVAPTKTLYENLCLIKGYKLSKRYFSHAS
ncbi:MAG: hypothetical protein ACI9LM_001518 [Alteromonadaceae bacterium]|jgi:hypothetical protein